MLKKTMITLSTFIIFALILAGCQRNFTSETQEKEKFQEYQDTRVQYLGDNSKVSELLDKIGASNLGEYTIALQTEKQPYELTINYLNLKNKSDEEKFGNIERIDYAYFALALIENLNGIDIHYKNYNYHLTTDEANEFIRGDIKEYGKTTKGLENLNQILKPVD